jgi:hypothetical protein
VTFLPRISGKAESATPETFLPIRQIPYLSGKSAAHDAKNGIFIS